MLLSRRSDKGEENVGFAKIASSDIRYSRSFGFSCALLIKIWWLLLPVKSPMH
jgi:hypothetical protein